MEERPVTIINRLGLHARAAAKFVNTASRFDCTINFPRDLNIARLRLRIWGFHFRWN